MILLILQCLYGQGSSGFDTFLSSGNHFLLSPSKNVLEVLVPKEMAIGYLNKRVPDVAETRFA